MATDFIVHAQQQLQELDATGLFKRERIIITAQGARVHTADGRDVINLCANNYLGLSSHPQVMQAAHEALNGHGYGMSSVRFICGTQDLHKELEARLSRFLGTEDADPLRRCVRRQRWPVRAAVRRAGRSDLRRAEPRARSSTAFACARRSAGATSTTTWPISSAASPRRELPARAFRLVFSDGVFSMDGTIAQLDRMRELCDAHDALAWHRRVPRQRFHGRARARHARASRCVRQDRHRHRHAGQGARGAPRAASPRRAARWSSCCASARGPTCSATR